MLSDLCATGGRHLIIMRGLPGSGKSTQCAMLPSARVVSADDHFTCNGVYKFDPKQLTVAHTECYRQAMQAMVSNHPIVCVDNTNTTRAEYTPYVMLGRAYNYTVHLVCVVADPDVCFRRGLHNVPLTSIKAMATRYEAPAPHDPVQHHIHG